MKIKCTQEWAPIPVREFDWSVVDDDTYDGAPDAGHQIIGWGSTPTKALADFINQYIDAEGNLEDLLIAVANYLEGL
jgi:hypothetical protein